MTGPLPTAQVEFRSRYLRTMELAVALALGAHLTTLAVFPPVAVAPFRLPAPVDTMRAVELVPEFLIQEPPPDVSRPDLHELGAYLSVDAGEVALPEIALTEDTRNPFQDPIGGVSARPALHFASERSPEVIHHVAPVYPSIAREAGAEGNVLVEVEVDETGHVLRARVIASDTVPALRKAAMDAAREWLFLPALQAGRAIRARIRIPFRFRLH